jgi:hypothetical protein
MAHSARQFKMNTAKTTHSANPRTGLDTGQSFGNLKPRMKNEKNRE